MRSILHRHHRRGLSLVEILVVISIIAILISLLMPMMRLAREQAMTVTCRSNLHQIGDGCLAYATANEGRLPTGDPQQYQGNWEWDLSRTMTAQIMGDGQLFEAGGRRNVFYCPFVLDRQNPDGLWDFDPAFRVTGFFFLLQRNYSSIPAPNAPKCWKATINTKGLAPRDQEIATDVTLSDGTSFNAIYGGWFLPHTTSHIRGNTPLGGNILYMDGHVEWRPFSDMQSRCGSWPQFWF
jgi:prepilin-type N-terminal cleavage/methylation domain-containing protein/prepilin-type processing-associated H-X9-DG protein